MQYILGVILLFFLFYGDPDVFDVLRSLIMTYLSAT